MENNVIFDKVNKAYNGHYVHALEVESIEDIDNCIAEIVNHYGDDGIEAVKEFFNTLQIYYIGDDSEIENSVYNYITDSVVETFFDNE